MKENVPKCKMLGPIDADLNKNSRNELTIILMLHIPCNITCYLLFKPTFCIYKVGVYKKYNNLPSYILRWSTVIFKYQRLKMYDLKPTKASLHAHKMS